MSSAQPDSATAANKLKTKMRLIVLAIALLPAALAAYFGYLAWLQPSATVIVAAIAFALIALATPYKGFSIIEPLIDYYEKQTNTQDRAINLAERNIIFWGNEYNPPYGQKADNPYGQRYYQSSTYPDIRLLPEGDEPRITPEQWFTTLATVKFQSTAADASIELPYLMPNNCWLPEPRVGAYQDDPSQYFGENCYAFKLSNGRFQFDSECPEYFRSHPAESQDAASPVIDDFWMAEINRQRDHLPVRRQLLRQFGLLNFPNVDADAPRWRQYLRLFKQRQDTNLAHYTEGGQPPAGWHQHFYLAMTAVDENGDATNKVTYRDDLPHGQHALPANQNGDAFEYVGRLALSDYCDLLTDYDSDEARQPSQLLMFFDAAEQVVLYVLLPEPRRFTENPT